MAPGFLAPNRAELLLEYVIIGSSVVVAAAACLLRTARPTGSVFTTVGGHARRSIVLAVFVASLSRIISMAAVLALQSNKLTWVRRSMHLDLVQVEWMVDVLILTPSLLYISAFSWVVLLWAKAHATAKMMHLKLADCFFFFITVGCYFVVAAFAAATFLLRVYGQFWIYVSCMIALLDVSVGLAIFAYGVMLVLELARTARKRHPGPQILWRAVILSVAFPLLLVACGSSEIARNAEAAEPSLLLTLIRFLAAEWLPSVIVLMVLCGCWRTTVASEQVSLDSSTDSEAMDDLLLPRIRDPPKVSHTDVKWKQLYPQPS